MGYIKTQNRMYLLNKLHTIVSFEVVQAVCQFQTAIIIKDNP